MKRLSTAQRLPLVGRFWPGAQEAHRGIAADVAKVAESLGLGALLDRRPGQPSGGQRQRVALARAIVRHPAAFLMDEPLSNLDAALRVQTRREIVDIHHRSGAATLYVTHDQAEALTIADHAAEAGRVVAVMQAGRILQVGTPEEIYADPVDLRVATFIGSPRINTLPAEAGADGLVRIGDMPTGLRAPPGGLTFPQDGGRSAAGGLPYHGHRHRSAGAGRGIPRREPAAARPPHAERQCGDPAAGPRRAAPAARGGAAYRLRSRARDAVRRGRAARGPRRRCPGGGARPCLRCSPSPTTSSARRFPRR